MLIVIAGTGLAFGMWWSYFVVPAGEILYRHRRRAWVWGYGGIVIFAAIAAMGAGLEVAAYVAEGEAAIGVVGAVLTVAVPVLVSVVAYFAIYSYLVHAFDPFHMLLLAGAVVVLSGRAPGAGGRRPRCVPCGDHARPGGHRRGLRDRRAPAHERGRGRGPALRSALPSAGTGGYSVRIRHGIEPRPAPGIVRSCARLRRR